MLEFLLDGGPIMTPLFLLSVLGLAVIIDRVRAFRLAEEADPEALFRDVTSNIDKGDLDAAIGVCQATKGPIATVLYVALHKYRVLLGLSRGRDEIEQNLNKTISEFAPHVIEILEKRLNLLLMVGSVSPLLGMTGTVTGMIASFKSMSQVGGMEGGAVAAGISEALITTAAGLIIAIPSVVCYNVFSKKVDNLALQIEEKAADMVEYIHLYHPDDKQASTRKKAR